MIETPEEKPSKITIIRDNRERNKNKISMGMPNDDFIKNGVTILVGELDDEHLKEFTEGLKVLL